MNLILFTLLFCFLICFSCVFLSELQEGSLCTSEEGMRGICVDIHKCVHVVKDLKEKIHPQICSYKNQIPIVCCTDCELVNDTRTVMIDRFGLHYFRTGSKAYDKCIEYSIDEQYPCRIWGGVQRYLDDEKDCYNYTMTSVMPVAAGGMDAERGSFPHMALLGYGETVKSADWLCGGSIISHKYILTAAHCLTSHASGPVKFLALGILKRSDDANMWQHYNVKRSIPYPDFKAPSKYHDIALLESEKWIKFRRFVLPACLNTGDAYDHVAFATGWGAKGHRQAPADTLQKVLLMAYTEEECATFYPQHRNLIHGYNHTTQMCYGDKENINDTCEGDSGGPLQVNSQVTSCMHTIVGVTSYGTPCGIVGGSGMYTRVSYYVPWIESIVWP